MITIEQSIDVEAPLPMIYNQWTKFPEFPLFMPWVKEVEQEQNFLYWRGNLANNERIWESRVIEQTRDLRLRWVSLIGAPNAGAVLVKSRGPSLTRVYYAVAFPHEYFAPQAEDAWDILSEQVTEDLARFKDLMESRAVAKPVWTGGESIWGGLPALA